MRPLRPVGLNRVLLVVDDGAKLADALATVTRVIDSRTGTVRVAHFRTWSTVSEASSKRVISELSSGDAFAGSREHAIEVTDALVNELGRRNVRADGIMLESPPGGLAALIASAANNWQADLIVLGSHGRGPARQDSQDLQDELVRLASCPVTVATR